MSRIAFVYPDYENLGVEYLMAVCLENGHEVEFIFYHADDIYLAKKVKDIPFQQIAGEIAASNADIVAFSCVTDNYQYQLSCAKALKGIRPDIITIFGGVHPTAVPTKVLANAEVDCVAIAEAEKSFLDFIEECGKGDAFTLPEKPVEGIAFKKNGEIIGEFKEGPLTDVNDLPFPHKAPFLSSLKDSSHEYRAMTSRGCPYSCSYCFNYHFHELRGKKFLRQREVDNVIDELLYAKSNYPLKYILFVDDCFTTNKKWILEFCSRYEKEIGLPFGCISNPIYINKEVTVALSSAGCVNIQIGIQSLSEELCSNVLNRKSDNAKIAQVITNMKDAGVMVQVDHMLGIPGDSIKLQEEALLFYNKYRPNVISIFWLTYYPKTGICDVAIKEGLLSDADIAKIEEGKKLTEGSFLAGGSMSNPKPFYSIAFLLNYLPILPKWIVSCLIYSRLYRLFVINNFFISTALPRVIQSIFNRRDFRGRSHIIRFFDKTFLKRKKKV